MYNEAYIETFLIIRGWANEPYDLFWVNSTFDLSIRTGLKLYMYSINPSAQIGAV